MNKFFLIFIILISCKTNNTLTESRLANESSVFECPEDGTCSFEILKNKQIKLKSDEFGKSYIEIENKLASDLLKFNYKRNPIEDTADSNYEEIVFFQMNEFKDNMSLKDEALTSVNAIYGRLCFCRGSSGYFPIKQGTLNIEKLSNSNYQITFDFKINEVPQIITFFSKTIDLQ